MTTKRKTDDIHTLAEMALSNARRQLEATGQLDPKTALQVNGRVKWLPDTPGEIMNHAELKEKLFGGLRLLVKQTGATAVILVTDSWTGEPTEKQEKMARENPEELRRLATSSSLDDMEALGLVRRVEAIAISVQTPEEVFLLQQLYERHGSRIVWTERRETTSKQDEYHGRTKMYGDKGPVQ